jgi:hypothetical protein
MAQETASPAETGTEGCLNGTTNGKVCEPNAGAIPPREDTNQTQSTAGPTDPSRLERAEKLADRLAANVAVYASLWGRKLIRLTAHMRETVEDMWAEAQDIRRQKK